MTILKKNFFSCVCIKWLILPRTCNLWLNERHVVTQLRLTNLPALTNKYTKKYNEYKEYKKQRSELNISTKQPNRRFIRVELALKIIMNCRTDESCNLKKI